MIEDEMLERLAELEHEQWMAWSQSVAAEVSAERRQRRQRAGCGMWICLKK